MSYTVTYAGETNEDHGLLVYRRPSIRTSELDINTYSIPGREMDLIERSGSYQPAKVDVVFNYACAADAWGAAHRAAILWLRKNGNLVFSDDAGFYRKVLYVDIGENERVAKRIGKFTATFVCKPGIYLVSGAEFANISALAASTSGTAYTLQNDYSACRPVYRLTGNGECVLTVNGSSMTAAVTGNLTIDTDLKIAYKSADAVTNTAVTGDYDSLALASGENTISVTSGFTLEIQTNYRVM